MTRLVRPLVLVLTLLVLVGCDQMDTNVARVDARVQPISVGEPYVISAMDLAAAMLQAGFTREEILELGPKVQVALAASGGVQINEGRAARAILSVQDNQLFISSRATGTFIRDL